jgi:hypothetical protein
MSSRCGGFGLLPGANLSSAVRPGRRLCAQGGVTHRLRALGFENPLVCSGRLYSSTVHPDLPLCFQGGIFHRLCINGGKLARFPPSTHTQNR